MVTVGLLVRLEAKVGKEDELARLLQAGLSFVMDEVGTPAWVAFRLSHTTFGIFDVFPDERARRTHLAGQLAAALTSRADALLQTSPSIETVDVIAAKLPQ